MNILILAQYLGDISVLDKNNSRFLTIAELFINKGHNVKIITSDYIHNLKTHINYAYNYNGCEIVLLHEPGYPQNVCLKRISSHKVLADNLSTYLADSEIPDMIYCAVPSLDFAYAAAKYAKSRNIYFVLDIQDLWPEAFEMVVPFSFLNKILFSTWRKKANAIYSFADSVIAVSDTYLQRALSVNVDCKSALTVYLGTNLGKFDKYKDENVEFCHSDSINIVYVGTLGHSYDLKTAFDALHLLKDHPSYRRIQMIVIGDGPLRDEFESYAVDRNLNVVFTGMLPYPQMVATLCKCNIAINPIRKKSAGSIINKHADYAAAGLPVVNTQESTEYRYLIDKYKMGFNCRCENSRDVADCFIKLIEDSALREEMGMNSRRCAEELFARENTYSKILDVLDK